MIRRSFPAALFGALYFVVGFFIALSGRALAAEAPDAGTVQTVELPGAVPLEMVWIPAGTFDMGQTPGERDAYPNKETPRHRVTLTRGFWMGKCEVTKAQWRAVMGTSPWSGREQVSEDPASPAVYISWDAAQAFTRKLAGHLNEDFRLPTEAEWEYACRAGTTTRFPWGDDLDYLQIDAHAWWRGNVTVSAEQAARPVGTKQPNPWGLYDMSGNVSEWCQDWHGYYFDGESVDPVGPSSAAHRVLRGGGWTATGGRCRSSRRDHEEPKAEHSHIGFRVALGAPAPRPAGEPVFTDVFVAGEGGVSTYRIPAMITAPDGSLLAFCEARKIAQDDASPTDMVLRRSLDEGKTWLPVQTLVPGTGAEALMNPCAVVNRKTGEVVLVGLNAHKNGPDHHRCLVLKSADNGVTWSAPRDITEAIINADDRFVPGPGIGVQMDNGRLVIPGYIGQTTIEIEENSRSCVMFSDDGGDTWTMGAPVADLSDESQVVSLKDGRLMLNMRGNMGRSCRGVATSTDGGASWSTVRWDAALNECPCQASILRYSAVGKGGKDGILFANPDNFGELYGVVERTKMTVRMSYDEGATWPVKRIIHAGPSSYSTLVQLSNGDIGILFEGGEKHRREWIRFARFSMAWLTGGKLP